MQLIFGVISYIWFFSRNCYEKFGKKQEPSEKDPSNNPTVPEHPSNPKQPVDTSETIEQITKHLSELLENKKWKEADTETSNILLKAARQENRDYFKYEDIEQFDCKLLLKIDKNWRYKSDKIFGFNVQK